MSRLDRSRTSRRQILALVREARAAVSAVVPRVHSALQRRRRLVRKGEGDFVTAVDRAIERELRRRLLAEAPEHGFLGEETGLCNPAADLVWVVDPIDGTSNFGRGLASFAISVACLERGQPLAAAVHCWPEGVLYSAGRGLGAWRERRPVRIAPGRGDDGAILGAQWLRGAAELEFLDGLTRSGARIRVLGSTVVQDRDVLRGALDGNVQQQGRIWDLAACGLILAEAGALVTDWRGGPLLPFPSLTGDAHYPSVVASPRTHAAIVAALRSRRQ